MIDFPLEEAEVFDRLTIILVKARKTIDIKLREKLLEQANEIECLLNQKLGYDKARNVSKSKEFNDLFDVNLKLFELVDLAKVDAIKASEVDKFVFVRHVCKKELQKKFFNSEFSEIKLNYNANISKNG